MSPSILAAWLAIAPAEPPTSVELLDQAIAAIQPTSASAQELAEALASAEAHPLEFTTDGALATLDRARLALVAVHVALGDGGRAEAAMDEAIRSAMGRSLQPGIFGPDVLALYERRSQILEQAGRATIEIDCESCRVIIDETRSPNPSVPLYLGDYRVWVRPTDPAVPPKRFDIDLRQPGEVARRTYRPPAVVLSDLEPTPQPGRLLPRWAEILGASVGATAVLAGGILAGLDGKCKGNPGRDTGDSDACPEVYDNQPQAYILLGLGAGLMVAAGVTLTIDEVRVGRARGRRAMLTWTLRF